MKKSYRKVRKSRKNVKKFSKKLSKRSRIKKRSKLQVVKATPTGFSSSLATITYKPGVGVKNMKYLGQSSVFDFLTAFGGIGDVNKTMIMANQNMYVLTGTAIGVLCDSSLKKLDATGSVVTSPLIQTGQKSFKILLDSCNQEITCTNASATNITFDIYNLVAKVTKVATSNPATDWTLGLADETVGSSPAPDAYTIGSNPLAVKRFNMNWGLLKKTTVSLGVGRCHTHKFNFRPNRIIDTSYTSQYDMIRGITCATMIVGRGSVCDSFEGYSVGNLGISRCKLLTMCRNHFVTRIVSDTPKHYQSVDTLIDPGFLFIKEEDGDVINAAVAANFA